MGQCCSKKSKIKKNQNLADKNRPLPTRKSPIDVRDDSKINEKCKYSLDKNENEQKLDEIDINSIQIDKISHESSKIYICIPKHDLTHFQVNLGNESECSWKKKETNDSKKNENQSQEISELRLSRTISNPPKNHFEKKRPSLLVVPKKPNIRELNARAPKITTKIPLNTLNCSISSLSDQKVHSNTVKPPKKPTISQNKK